MHSKSELEQKVNIFRLKYFYSDDLYSYLSIGYFFGQECNQICYPYIYEFYKLALDHDSPEKVGSDMMHFMKNENDNLILFDTTHHNLITLENLLLSIHLNKIDVNLFLCEYHTTNQDFILKLKQKYGFQDLNCTQFNNPNSISGLLKDLKNEKI